MDKLNEVMDRECFRYIPVLKWPRQVWKLRPNPEPNLVTIAANDISILVSLWEGKSKATVIDQVPNQENNAAPSGLLDNF